METCKNCNGPHHVQQCPEVWQAMRGNVRQEAAGRAIARHWHTRPQHFVETLRRLDPGVWHLLANAYVAYRGGALEDVLTAWWLAVSETQQIPATYRDDIAAYWAAADATVGAIEGVQKAPA